ncbi:ATP-NAD kinase family protein [Candidatus Bipolaricaulota bacterium]
MNTAAPRDRPRRVGLIVNPVAGLGGRVGLKGSDGVETQQRALALGAEPQAHQRAIQAMERLAPMARRLDLITYPGQMGETAARHAGLTPNVIGTITPGRTTPDDTKTAAREMLRLGIDLLLFAGGDGTAHDLYDAIGEDAVVLGIPAGVKVHSAAFAISPTAAGEVALRFLTGKITQTCEAEVVDADEEALRQDVVSTTLRGVLRIPLDAARIQGAKVASYGTDATAASAIARCIVDHMEPDAFYIVGPGTTTRAIFTELGIKKTLLGVDVLQQHRLLASDVNEAQLLELLDDRPAKILVAPVGGQGYLFGRGNQQISPSVLRCVGVDNVLVIATPEKLNRLTARPLLVDSGDENVDRALAGYIRVTCGPDDIRVVRVAAAAAAAPIA